MRCAGCTYVRRIDHLLFADDLKHRHAARARIGKNLLRAPLIACGLSLVGDAMGNDMSKRDAIALISAPENKEDLEHLFKSFDKDKNGSLDAKEWKAFGKLLWEVDVDEAHAQGQNEVRTPRSGPPSDAEN